MTPQHNYSPRLKTNRRLRSAGHPRARRCGSQDRPEAWRSRQIHQILAMFLIKKGQKPRKVCRKHGIAYAEKCRKCERAKRISQELLDMAAEYFAERKL